MCFAGLLIGNYQIKWNLNLIFGKSQSEIPVWTCIVETTIGLIYLKSLWAKSFFGFQCRCLLWSESKHIGCIHIHRFEMFKMTGSEVVYNLFLFLCQLKDKDRPRIATVFQWKTISVDRCCKHNEHN